MSPVSERRCVLIRLVSSGLSCEVGSSQVEDKTPSTWGQKGGGCMCEGSAFKARGG